MNELGKALVVLGALFAAVGALLWAGLGNWFGKLPGDLHYSRGNFSFHLPVITCVLASVVITILLWLFRR